MEIICSIIDKCEKPAFSKSWSYEEIRKILQGVSIFKGSEISFYDRDYVGISKENLSKFFEKMELKKIKYRPESFDCDDFSLCSKSLLCFWLRNSLPEGRAVCFGTIMGDLRLTRDTESNHHIMNIFIDSVGKIFLYEPQNNTFYSPEKLFPSSSIRKIQI